jgi:hypothetical protein
LAMEQGGMEESLDLKSQQIERLQAEIRTHVQIEGERTLALEVCQVQNAGRLVQRRSDTWSMYEESGKGLRLNQRVARQRPGRGGNRRCVWPGWWWLRT